ncbi:MAG: glycerophosphodiester phosphodiesterase [Actinomycetota bacterium]|nr:glycerophosphodiester phosphodiesterase [Actinomycetota bacterium]
MTEHRAVAPTTRPGNRVPRVLAHRGSPAEGVAENSLAAFLRAADLGADGVELDARSTADGAVAVHHDPTIEEGPPVAELTVGELPPEVPLLAEVLAALPGLRVNIEIKNLPGEPGFDPDERTAGAVVGLVREAGAAARVVVSSFWTPALQAVRALDPDLPIGLLTPSWMEPEAALEAARVLGADALHAAHVNVGPALVAAAHGSGIEVCAWTATAPRDLRRLADAGVDTVITDDVVTARAVLGEARP